MKHFRKQRNKTQGWRRLRDDWKKLVKRITWKEVKQSKIIEETILGKKRSNDK